MTKQVSSRMATVAIMFLVTWYPYAGLAVDKANYSGKYSLQEKKTPTSSETEVTLHVVQTDDAIEITKVEQGRKLTNRYPLNGPDGDYKTPTGVPGKCKAQLKDKYLVLESVVVTPTQPNGPSMRMHIKERWQLSKDSKILTIKTEIDFPDAPPMVSSIVGEYGSGTEKYIRTEGR
jgi:hypothetical protein